jgi:hypothetical protein
MFPFMKGRSTIAFSEPMYLQKVLLSALAKNTKTGQERKKERAYAKVP